MRTFVLALALLLGLAPLIAQAAPEASGAPAPGSVQYQWVNG
jgi:hypothetical protein